MSVARPAQSFRILSPDGAHFKHLSSGAAKAFVFPFPLSFREAGILLLT
jgi:hypothetical protein